MEVLRRGLVRRDLNDEKELSQAELGTECYKVRKVRQTSFWARKGQSSGEQKVSQWGRIIVRRGENGDLSGDIGLVSHDKKYCFIIVQWEATEQLKQRVEWYALYFWKDHSACGGRKIGGNKEE